MERRGSKNGAAITGSWGSSIADICVNYITLPCLDLIMKNANILAICCMLILSLVFSGFDSRYGLHDYVCYGAEGFN